MILPLFLLYVLNQKDIVYYFFLNDKISQFYRNVEPKVFRDNLINFKTNAMFDKNERIDAETFYEILKEPMPLALVQSFVSN